MSNYSGFDVIFDPNNGSAPTLLGSQTVHVYDITHSTALADITSPADGHVPGGTLAVAAGTLIRFYVTLADGRCGFVEKVTA